MKKQLLSALAFCLLASSASSSIILKKWNTYIHEWQYVGFYRCNHLGEILFYSNAEISYWRVYHYNEHQRFDNFTRLWVRLSDGTYVHAHTIESRTRGNIYFRNNTAMQNFLSNLTS